MFCSNCGKKLVEGSKFCSGCGSKAGEALSTTQNVKTISAAAQAYFEQAQEYHDIQDFDNAYAAYKAAVQIEPVFPEAQKKMAQICMACQDNKQAGKILNNVISNNPDDYEAFFYRGGVYGALEKPEKALMDFNIALKIKPDYIDAYKAIIVVHKAMGAWDKLIDISSMAIKIAPQDESLYGSRAEAFFNTGSLDEALSDYSIVLKINPNDIQSLYSRGMTYFEKKDYEKSLLDIDRVFELNPGNFSCQLVRGKIFFYTGEYKKSRKELDSFISILESVYAIPPSPEPYKYRAMSCYKSGWYNARPNDIKNDFWSLRNMVFGEENDFNEEEYLGFFRDVMTDRYKKAIRNYNKEKKHYIVAYRKKGLITKEYYIYASRKGLTVEKNYCWFSVTNKTNNEVFSFFDETFVDDYFDSSLELKVVEKNVEKDRPVQWLIYYDREVYYKNGKIVDGRPGRKWGRYSPGDSGCKYDTLEDALEDYIKIIHTEQFLGIGWYLDEGGDGGPLLNTLTNIYIVGIHRLEDINP